MLPTLSHCFRMPRQEVSNKALALASWMPTHFPNHIQLTLHLVFQENVFLSVLRMHFSSTDEAGASQMYFHAPPKTIPWKSKQKHVSNRVLDLIVLLAAAVHISEFLRKTYAWRSVKILFSCILQALGLRGH